MQPQCAREIAQEARAAQPHVAGIARSDQSGRDDAEQQQEDYGEDARRPRMFTTQHGAIMARATRGRTHAQIHVAGMRAPGAACLAFAAARQMCSMISPCE